MRALRRRYGHARKSRSVFSLVSEYDARGTGRIESFGTMKKAVERAHGLEGRGYQPYIFEFNEERPERHRLIVYGSHAGELAPKYTGGA